MKCSRLAGLALLILGLAPTGRAHDPGLSVANVQVSADRVIVVTGYAPADARALLLADASGSSSLPIARLVDEQPRADAAARDLWEVRDAGGALSPIESGARLVSGDNVSFRAVFPRPTGSLTLHSRCFERLPPGHREFLSIYDAQGHALARKLLRTDDASLTLDLAPPSGDSTAPAPPPAFWAFLALGVEHIWTGYDHLLFLFGLLVVCRSFRSIAAIISCFTLAHSITLALATVGAVVLPGRFVEPAIAASIAFVGIENLVRRGAEPQARWALTFGFGLIHGFGFASALGDLGVGRDGHGIAVPLLTFNLGVELGQIAVAAAVLPLVWQLRKSDRFLRRGVPALSLLVALAGAYWLLARTLLA